MTKQEILSKLQATQISKNKDGNYIARWSFFYTHGQTADKKKEKVLTEFPNAEIIDSGEIWKPFKGGASIKQQSHWYVEFKI